MALGNLAQRFLVAVVAVPILLLILAYQRHEPAWGLIFAASLIAMREFFVMTLPKEDRLAALVMGALACAAFYWFDISTMEAYHIERTSTVKKLFAGAVTASSAITLVFAVVVPFLFFLFRFRDIPTVAKRMTATITGIVYAGFLTTFLALLKRVDLDVDQNPTLGFGNAVPVVIVLVVAWLADTGGYFAGRFLGNAKLYPAVSPKKTWAGAYGGLAGAILGVLVIKLAFPEMLTWVDVFAIAIPGAILGMLGDLAESLIKRSVDVKDSGALLPGHGGILDRIDAVLFIAPYVYLYLRIKQAV
jgi:phosphatidate cytidylyltransferase